MLSEIFKAYDVRGIYGETLTEDITYKIAKGFATFLKAKEVIVGHDMRTSAPTLVEAFMRGLSELGVKIVYIGLVSTDGLYFASGKLNLPGVMFTASHNPKKYNGIKFCKEEASPLNFDNGLKFIQEIIEKESYESVTDSQGTIRKKDITSDFADHVRSFVDVNSLTKLKIAVDAGNGMGGKIVPAVYDDLSIEIVPLYFELDGDFPNHPADPSKFENLKDLQKKVKEESCDFGMAFDGDADRIFFVDENGDVCNSSLISSLIVKTLLEKNPNEKVVHNLVCSKIVKDTIKKNNGHAIRERVGHSYIKETMRKENALFGCEHSAHYYYRDNFTADSGIITSVLIAEIVSKSGKKLSELLNEFKVYHTIEETNSEVSDKETKMKELKEHYEKQNPEFLDELDGISIDFGSWRFNVRPSNTEPLLRLNLEADSEELMQEKKEEVLGLIRN